MGGQELSFDTSLSLFGNKFAKASNSGTPHAEKYFLFEFLCESFEVENISQNSISFSERVRASFIFHFFHFIFCHFAPHTRMRGSDVQRLGERKKTTALSGCVLHGDTDVTLNEIRPGEHHNKRVVASVYSLVGGTVAERQPTDTVELDF